MQLQDDALHIRARMVPGTRFQMTEHDFVPDNVDMSGVFVVSAPHEQGIFCYAEADPSRVVSIPVGCIQGPTEAMMDPDRDGFAVGMVGMDGTTLHYRFLPTVYWSLVEKPGRTWLAVEEGEDFDGMARRLMEVLSDLAARKEPMFPEVRIVGRDFALANPELYPIHMNAQHPIARSENGVLYLVRSLEDS